MAITDNKYTGKNTRVKLNRLMNLSSEHVVKNKSTKECGLVVDNILTNVSGKILSKYTYKTQINIPHNVCSEKLVITSLRLSDAYSFTKNDESIIIKSKTVDGFTLESTVKMEE